MCYSALIISCSHPSTVFASSMEQGPDFVLLKTVKVAPAPNFFPKSWAIDRI